MRCSVLAAPGGLGAGLLQHAVLEEVAVGDRLGDAREVLVDDAAGADVEVPDLGVAHLARRQADGRPGGVERAVRVPATSRSKTGVRARLMALPGPGGAQPQPSSTMSTTGR